MDEVPGSTPGSGLYDCLNFQMVSLFGQCSFCPGVFLYLEFIWSSLRIMIFLGIMIVHQTGIPPDHVAYIFLVLLYKVMW